MNSSIQQRDRIESLDVLRGLAIFGILVVNVEQMFLPMFIANSPIAMIPGEWGMWFAWLITDAFFENKFITIFSLLFGIGFCLQWLRTEQEPKRFRHLYFRRLFVLALFGLGHAVFFYAADVLIIYALVALLQFPMKRLSASTLLLGGAGLLIATVMWHAFISSPSADEFDLAQRQKATVDEISRMKVEKTIRLSNREYDLPIPQSIAITVLDGNNEEEQAKVEYAVYSYGPVGAAIFGRTIFLLELLLLYTPFYLAWRTLALFMLGAGLVKWGVLENSRQVLWRRIAFVSMVVGLPMTIVGTFLRAITYESPNSLTNMGDLLHDISSLFLAVAICTLVFLWCSNKSVDKLRRGLANVGRTALTNYLGQSIVMSFIATSYGFGLYGDLTRLQLLVLSIIFFAGQILICTVWLHYFRMGPLEWVWRCLTYWKLLSLWPPSPKNYSKGMVLK